ncbi:threonine/homoserine efflux transporter RhtA [Mucilaginibacter yixingensis]|uniref:Threonine/homoserine efflux transporter RhtA n=1 Tax=Mucilaginibacter yixingensis TaxID=1295612 RepID=A0A2T5JGY8_9SPHI|nr:DMT family transporter [Mucilaginibacter yixingensis]PTR01678.1 threonine/homoserine efflux transporter RhtA [Mucilaginibacter yixingensis]
MKKKYLLLQFAVVIAGFTGVFGKLISLDAVLLVWYRVAFSALGGLAVLTVVKPKVRLRMKDRLKIGRVGLLLTAHWLFFYASIRYANISVGVVCFCLTSFFTAFLSPLINRKKFVYTEVFFSMLTLAGISLIFGFDSSFRTGIILGVISSCFSALYTIFNERLVKHYDSRQINFYQMLSGTIGLGVLLPLYLHFVPVKVLIPGLRDTVYLIFLALICTVGLYIMFAESLKRIPAFTVNMSFNLEPVYSIILAFIIFGESKELNIGFYLGLAVVIASVFIQPFVAPVKKENTL